jgi:hypothetical protein
MLLASLRNHRNEVTAFAPSHIVRCNIPICCDPSIIAGIIKNIKVVHAWESQELHLLKELVDLDALRRESFASC